MAQIHDDFYEKEVQQELFRMKVRDDAKRRFDDERLRELGLPEGVMAGSPIETATAELFPGIIPQHGAAGAFGHRLRRHGSHADAADGGHRARPPGRQGVQPAQRG